MVRRSAACAVTTAVALALAARAPAPTPARKPMSVSSRILLNRLAVTRHTRGELMLLASDVAAFDRVSRLVDRLHGRVRRAARAIGYMRVDLPLGAIATLADVPDVAAYEISSLSKGAWYRDGPPQDNAEMFRDREVARIGGTSATTPDATRLPTLTPEAASTPGYTGDDVGVGAWLAEHPTFDGRGVTIAVLESGEPEFLHPALSLATTLDGRPIPKIAGILNPLDPDESDETRVDLDTEIDAAGAWQRIGRRTYILPRPGRYRFGVFSVSSGANLVQMFAVLEDETTGEVRIDANGNADFRDDPPSADVNESFEPRTLRLGYPQPVDVAFVVARDRAHSRVYVYLARAAHQTMTISVAAGTRTPESLAFGVATGARVLLVRNSTSDLRLHDFFEAYIEAAKRPDVDILNDSTGDSLVPDTSTGFGGLFFHRLIAVYHKPVFRAAGNALRLLANVSSFGETLAVGGAMSRESFAALVGGGDIGETIVHPMSAGGPGVDGALKPDFIAPVPRIAADLFARSGPAMELPRNTPSAVLPRGDSISCCTSASSPYAAGVAALLLSAAKQRALLYSAESVGRALRAGARFLEDTPAQDQGTGIIDVQATWRELQRPDPPRIRVVAPVTHELAPYAANGTQGVGLFERGGWAVGDRGSRLLHLTRESGPTAPTEYQVSWTGNDGTFSSARSIVLPLNTSVAVPIIVSVATVGAHSAILNLHDPATDAIVLRTMTTIVAPVPFDANATARVSGVLPLMRSVSQYVSVPNGAQAIAVDLDVTRGSLGVNIVPSYGMVREYYWHVQPAEGRTFTKGHYGFVLPTPLPGVWSIPLSNDSAWREQDHTLISTDVATFDLSVRLLSASLNARRASDGTAALDISNDGAQLRATAIDVAPGGLRSEQSETSEDGLPRQFEIDIPRGTETLALQLHGAADADRLEIYLYDCTSGECFSYDFTVPAARDQSLVVRHPAAGRWIAAVDSAPFPLARERFELQLTIGAEPERHQSSPAAPRSKGARWSETIAMPRDRWTQPGWDPVVLFELVDTMTERENREHPWENRQGLTNFAERAVAIGRTLLRIK